MKEEAPLEAEEGGRIIHPDESLLRKHRNRGKIVSFVDTPNQRHGVQVDRMGGADRYGRGREEMDWNMGRLP